MNDIILSTQNGEPVASSRDVAKRFGKEHRNVMRDIENLMSEGVLKIEQTPLFFKSEYTHPQNHQKYPMYLMNRDGFSLLAMGFTGKEAVQWKLKYIAAFNAMEKQLAQRPQLSRAELMAQALEKGEQVKLSGFGVFQVRAKRARMGRNPKTGEPAAIEPRRVIGFRASQVMKARVDRALAK